MNSFIYKTVRFNRLGDTPVGFSPSNMEAAYGIFAEEVEEVRLAMDIVETISETHTRASMHTSGVATEIVDGCVDTCVTAIGILYRMGLTAEQINEAFEVVAESNLSKFPHTEEAAIESVEAYKDDDRYENIQYKPQGNAFVVFGSKTDGTADYKILKGTAFVDPEQQLRKLVGDVYVTKDAL